MSRKGLKRSTEFFGFYDVRLIEKQILQRIQYTGILVGCKVDTPTEVLYRKL